MTVQRADQWIAYFLRVFRVLGDTDQNFQLWRALVKTHVVTGHKSHDARLVAADIGPLNIPHKTAHRDCISYILDKSVAFTNNKSFNTADFKRFPNINLLDPRTIS